MRRLILLLALLIAAPLHAQQPAADQALRHRADQVLGLLRGEGDPAEIFSPAFLAQIPPAQVRTVTAQLAQQYGAPQRIDRLEVASPQAALVHIVMARATVHLQLAIDPQAPNRITGLLITGADMNGDSLTAVLDEIRALPGQKSISVVRIGDGGPRQLAALEPDRPLAIGSAFKLFVLAELNRQIAAGQHHWSDVVPLNHRSMPSGTLQTWPQGAPVTLHTLAAMMISISDNTAADTLLALLGRENVERMMVRIGVANVARNRPFLSTLEMATLKTGPAANLDAWLHADEAGRRRLLATDYAAIDVSHVDVARFTGNPMAIDSVEWFASASDLVKVMDWLRLNADDTARAILSINTALGAVAGQFAYVGYKGGSEPGVLNLTWLVRNRAGAWHVITGSWNNVAAPVDEQRFVALMVRAVQLVR